MRAYVIRRDGGRCVRCGSRVNLQAHHVVPTAFGGLDIPSNLRTHCENCHDQIHGR